MNRVFQRAMVFGFTVGAVIHCGTDGSPTDPPTGPQPAAISGFVRVGQTPIRGARVQLTGPATQRAIDSAIDGGFVFRDLAPGIYTMTAAQVGVTCGSTSVEMGPGETVTASIACTSTASAVPGSIRGLVLGVDPSSGGVQVALTGIGYDHGQTIERAVLADSIGFYTFAQLPWGTYAITATVAGLDCGSIVVFLTQGTIRNSTESIRCTAKVDDEPIPPPPMIGMGKIAFERDGRIMVLDLDTNDLFHFTDGLAPAWSPDGRRLAFQRPACEDWSLPPYSNCDDIWVVNADGSGLSAVTSSEWVYDQDPVWSPDGLRIAFVRFVHGPDQSYLVVADVDPPSELWAEAVLSVWHPFSDAAWSPDGSQIAFTCQGPPPRWEFDLCAVPSNRNLGYMSGGTGSVRRVTTGKAVDSDPAWSPDGTRIAFTTDREAGIGSIVALIGTEGSGYQPLVAGADPAWSPDGSRIVFVGGADAPGLHIMNRDGTGLIRITEDPADRVPSWGR